MLSVVPVAAVRISEWGSVKRDMAFLLKDGACVHFQPTSDESRRTAVLPLAAYRVAGAAGPDFSAVAACCKLCFARISFMRFIVSGWRDQAMLASSGAP